MFNSLLCCSKVVLTFNCSELLRITLDLYFQIWYNINVLYIMPYIYLANVVFGTYLVKKACCLMVFQQAFFISELSELWRNISKLLHYMKKFVLQIWIYLEIYFRKCYNINVTFFWQYFIVLYFKSACWSFYPVSRLDLWIYSGFPGNIRV